MEACVRVCVCVCACVCACVFVCAYVYLCLGSVQIWRDDRQYDGQEGDPVQGSVGCVKGVMHGHNNGLLVRPVKRDLR